MNFIKDVKLQEDNKYNMIVEIKKGSKNKYELVEPSFDSLAAVRKIKIRYPFYYGCFPQTLAGDGDALDAILIPSKKHKELDIVNVQPIAVIKTIDNGEEDNKIICIEGNIKNLDKAIKIVMNFLRIYKGKKSNTVIDESIYDDKEALRCIARAHKAFAPEIKTVNSLKVN